MGSGVGAESLGFGRFKAPVQLIPRAQSGRRRDRS